MKWNTTTGRKGRRLKTGRTFWGRVLRVRRKFLTSVWCYFTRARMQTVTTEQLGGDYTGITCELDGEGKVEVRKWPLSGIAEQDETQRGSPRASTSSFHVSHYENDVWRFWRLHANLSCFVFVVVLCPFLVVVFRKSLITFTRRLQMKSGLLSPGVNSHTPPPYISGHETPRCLLCGQSCDVFSASTPISLSDMMLYTCGARSCR